jgi:AsmA protein
MPTTDPTLDQIAKPSHRHRTELLLIALFVLLVLVAVFLPPYLNVNRFQRRIATNIGASLGRPVHLDRVSLTLLPLPGFTLEKFVVDEDPAFGYEPILRADEVRATVRISSLWSRRVEFSRISLTDPSVNLVRNPDGRWNLESILGRASRIDAAPTAQLRAGPTPRFPYIEATGARVNFKLGQEKTPFSFTDADFSLWLPQPRQWRLRLEAHPSRTDTAPADTGTLRLEATLGNGAIPVADLTQLPIDLHGDWRDAQLGGVSRLILGRDAGLRGDLALTFSATGTLDKTNLATGIKLTHGRRADFIPPHLLSLEASCQAVAQTAFHALASIECHWPPAGSSDLSTLILAASVPDTRHPSSASAELTLPALPAATLLDWLSVATPNPPTGLLPTGTLAGTLTWNPTTPHASGEFELSGSSLQLPNQPSTPIDDVLLRSTDGASTASFELLPITLSLGNRQSVTVDGHFDATGTTLHLTGTATPARLLALGDAIPQLGEGLRALLAPTPPETDPGPPNPPAPETPATPTHFDLTATRPWLSGRFGPQTWRQTTPPTKPTPNRK